jgi:hypothetical protein
LQPTPKENDAAIRQHERFGKLFDETDIPDDVEGFECKDKERMAEIWPEGMDHAKEVGLAPNPVVILLIVLFTPSIHSSPP